MINENVLRKLTECVKQKFLHSLESPSDFDYLAMQVKKITKEDISATTLKRIFGYIPSGSKPRRSSLGILARYLGYTGWTDFSENVELCSGFVKENIVLESQLHKGDKISVSWMPDRKVTMVALENNRFEVLESHNAKIQSGDELTVMMLILGQPLQAKDVVRDGINMGNYIAGTEGGLTSIDVMDL